MLKKNIIWEDYNFNFDFEEIPDYHSFEELDESNLTLDSEDDEDIHGQIEKFQEERIKKLPKLMQTHFGVFRVDDTLNPFRRFEFRMAHCNFDITAKVLQIIENTPGVEVAHVCTRYRFIIGVGRSFTLAGVRRELERKLCGWHTDENLEKLPKKMKNQVYQIKHHLEGNKDVKKWYIYLDEKDNVNYEINKNDIHTLEPILQYGYE